NGAVFRSPHQERGIIANFGQRDLQFLQVRSPILQDAGGMLEGVILNYGLAITRERIGRNLRSVAEQTAQPEVVEVTPALDRGAEEEGAKRSAQERRQALAVRRPGIDGRYQDEALQAATFLRRTGGGHHDGHASAVRSTQQVEI